MIETIWPLSVLTCGRDTTLGAKQQNLIGLRTFVTEVLRRSKTSYSTLQVALYYLILIQASLPKLDFTMEQSEDSSACRAMQCGRRMFLAALILASKYLQDRNFSARAWSKISGLRTCEINTNELAFLAAVNWKLHIPETIFHRWTDVVLRYSPSASVNGTPRSLLSSTRSWRSLVPLLTPELEKIDELGLSDTAYDSGYDSPGSIASPPSTSEHEDMIITSYPMEPKPVKSIVIPSALEPPTCATTLETSVLPPLPRLCPLPTPQLTPQTGTFCTPAVSASGLCSRRPSMSYAMSEMRKNDLNRMTLDNPCGWKPRLRDPFQLSARRTSLSASGSSVSSPESMVSDRSSRPSRSSSISSIASSNCALPPPRLAVQATHRYANLQSGDLKGEGERTPVQQPLANCENRRPMPTSTQEAATALRELALSRQRISPPLAAKPSPTRSLKRSRPESVDLSVQSSVRELLLQRSEESGRVLRDLNTARTFMMQTENSRLASNMSENIPPKPLLCVEGLPRKRTCAGNDRGGRNEARMLERSVMVGGPGMWEGIV